MISLVTTLRRWALLCASALAAQAAPAATTSATTPATAPATAPSSTRQTLPSEVRDALARAKLPAEALAVWVHDLADPGPPQLSWNAQRAMSPASLFKLVTTQAGLELLGPSYSWSTPVWITGRLQDGVLDGSVTIQGRGDPKLVPERVWLLLHRLQQMGVREIRGDLVLDRSAFTVTDGPPGEFDGEPLRPYNARPDALLLAFRSVVYTFTPDPARGVARVSAEPALADHAVDSTVPLLPGTCDDWRAGLKATPNDPARMRFTGGYPAACGERSWPLAHADANGFAGRMLQAQWRDMGGRLTGTVREGAAPNTAPSFEISSPPLAEVVRDINKYSNNVMAQQLFLTLGLTQTGAGTTEAARSVLRQWLAQRLGEPLAASFVVDNGSGLSRQSRVTAEGLGALLQAIWRSPVMPELMSSLPVAGLDGTLKRGRAAPGRAHLKTGSLRDVVGMAGFVLTDNGRRLAVVALVNPPQANAARPALDALLRSVTNDLPASTAHRVVTE